MQRTRWAVIAVVMLVGLVWIGQGTGLLQGSSFMVGDPFWAVAGLTLVVAGGIVATVSLRRRGS
jgi:hypothetical protein